MKSLQLLGPSASPEDIQVSVVSQQMPTCGPTEAVVRVLMAAINPSDVKASLGHMPQAVFTVHGSRKFDEKNTR
jgi:NADPH:quinone reductase-like Zn-dependent oxidoreductase